MTHCVRLVAAITAVLIACPTAPVAGEINFEKNIQPILNQLPLGDDPLTPDDIKRIESWIQQGAVWPGK